MIGQSEQVGEELRSLLSAAISAAEPLLAQLTAADGAASTCTWCPVCALVALSRGESHPLLTAMSVHGATILAVLRDVIEGAAESHGAQADSAAHSGETAGAAQARAEPGSPPRRSAFERISVNLGEGVLDGADR